MPQVKEAIKVKKTKKLITLSVIAASRLKKYPGAIA
jgi:hypothetical protein